MGRVNYYCPEYQKNLSSPSGENPILSFFTAFLSGTSNIFGPSYFETTLEGRNKTLGGGGGQNCGTSFMYIPLGYNRYAKSLPEIGDRCKKK